MEEAVKAVGQEDGQRGGDGPGPGRGSLLGRVPAEGPVFLFYLLFTCYLTWPVITRFTTTVYGYPSDSLGTMWMWWWIKDAHNFAPPASTGFCTLVGYPFGTHLNLFPFEPIVELFERALLYLTNEVFVYNAVVLSSFLLSGITMYYLVRYLTRDRRAAFFGGFAFMICPYHAYHAMVFAHLAIIQWMPLYILVLLKFIKKPSGRNTVFLLLAAILVAGTGVHYGFFMAIFTAGFLAGRYVYLRLAARKAPAGDEARAAAPFNRRTLALSLAVLAGTAAFVLPFYYGSTTRSFPAGEWPTRPTSGKERNIDVSYEGAAQPWDYVLPEKENRFVGGVTRKLAGGSINQFENSLYVGWVVIALAVFALVMVSRRRRPPPGPDLEGEGEGAPPAWRSFELRKDVWGFVGAAVLCFVLSLPPYYRIGSFRLPMPSRIFMHTVPWLRWYMRIGIVVVICFIVLASLGISWLLAGRGGYGKELVLLLLMGLLFFETTLVPPFRYFEVDEVPEVYEYLADMPRGSSLVFYPAFETGFFNSQQYMFYQREFQQPMLNGASDNSDGEALRRTVYNPYTRATPGTLASFDIKYAVYLGMMFEQYEGSEPAAEEIKRLPPGLELVRKFESDSLFGNAYLFKVTAPREPLVPIYQGDITAPHIDEGRITVRLGNTDNLIRILNVQGEEMRARVRIPLANLAYEHRLTLTGSGRVLWEGTLAGGEQEIIEVPELTVPRDGMVLKLKVGGQPMALDPSEGMVFAATEATVKIGDVAVDRL